MVGRIAAQAVALAPVGLGLVLGALWWWAVVRLVMVPGAGALEGTVAAGGWGLSLLPVHCVAKARAAGVVQGGRWKAAWRGAGEGRRQRRGGEGGAGPEGCRGGL
ncbi:hypothetical protein [Streptomyces asoensis]|uniref:hypothetical protein n=1 Tax=Streptomyces asoensis TaxID=249586 RepID=UPI003F53E93D